MDSKYVVIGASAGGVPALCRLFERLPFDLKISVFVVVHIGFSSDLADVFKKYQSLRTANAVDGEAIKPGRAYLAPPDFHMEIEKGLVKLSRGPRENRFRPSIDVLFRSAARVYRTDVIGIILTGLLDDGSAGLHAIKARGGKAIVQHPDDAQESSMPRNAMRYTKVDHCVPLDEIPPLIARLSQSRTGKATKDKAMKTTEKGMTRRKIRLGHADAAPFTCPECSGPMFLSKEGKSMQLYCNVGHTFSPESLSRAHSETLERAVWIAVRSLNERQQINDYMSKRADSLRNPALLKRLGEESRHAQKDVKLLQDILGRL